MELTLAAADFAGELGAHFIIWPGIEGYNYPFQAPYRESWACLIDGIGEAAELCAGHGVKVFLEHKNSEPAMKIHMGNIGMTLHVIHKLRTQGIDNVQVNMDWQHLIMNGENLAEYAALLVRRGPARPPARQLRLGHVRRRQHGRRDRVHGDARARASSCAARATATTASGSASTSTRTPRTRSAAVARSVKQWRFIDGVAAKIDDDGAARGAVGARTRSRAYELVYAALGGMSVAIGLDVGTSGVKALALSEDGEVVGRAELEYGLSTPRPGWAEQDPEDWWRATQEALEQLGADDVAGIGLSGQMHGLVALDADEQVLRPAILWNDQRTGAECEEIEQRIGLEQLIAADRQPRADRLHGAEAAVARAARAGDPRADRAHPAAEGLRAAEAVRRARDRRRRRVGHAAVRRRAPEVERRGVRGARTCPRSGCRARSSRPRCRARRATASRSPRAPATRRRARSASASTRAGEPLSVVLGTSGVVFSALPSFEADPEARVHAFCHAVPETWHAMGVMLNAAGALRWLRDATGGVDYRTLDAEAAEWEPGVEGLTFLPYLAGERTPHADPDARGAFVGLSLRHDRGALGRAVQEGVAYGLRDSLDLIAELGDLPDRGRISGGGGRSESWLKIVASVLGAAARAHCRRRGRRVRRRAAGRRGRRAVGLARRGGRGDRAPDRHGRAGGRTGSSPTARAASASARSTRR